MGREYIGIELNPEYVKLINKRLGLFAQEFEG
jgi:DNA modification methylase